MIIGLKLRNLKNGKEFIKRFDTEYKRQCFLAKQKYFKNIVVLEIVNF